MKDTTSQVDDCWAHKMQRNAQKQPIIHLQVTRGPFEYSQHTLWKKHFQPSKHADQALHQKRIESSNQADNALYQMRIETLQNRDKLSTSSQ